MCAASRFRTSVRRALISVYDKAGVVGFAKTLAGELGVEILSTGGTARLLRDSGVCVSLVEEVAGFGEMLDGRVKTLHPHIHAAILADRDNAEHMKQLADAGIAPIDLVMVNLYPFEETVARRDCSFVDAVEMIDIGGPCMLRAAAKNHRHVVVVPDLAYAELVLDSLRSAGDVPAELRKAAATAVFGQTSRYDCVIGRFLAGRETVFPEALVSWRERVAELRYGENPQQAGAVYRAHRPPAECNTISGLGRDAGMHASRDAGDRMSFNNFADADSALGLCGEIARETVVDGGPVRVAVFVKHTNACGVGVADDCVQAYERAYLGDPHAAMGGILAVNCEVDAAFAAAVMDTYGRWGRRSGAGGFFVEVWLAPAFVGDSERVIRSSKGWGERVRLLPVGGMGGGVDAGGFDERTIAGGVLVQTRDLVGQNEHQWKVVTRRRPTDDEMRDLRLAWLVCKHTKSNAISVCSDGMLIGNGAGQMSRVMSCRIATWLAKENGHVGALQGAAAASDAFFPFRDGPELLMDAGVRAIIQPGGSKRDAETIAACDERDVAMVFSGARHFRH